MNHQNFTATFLVDQTPEKVFAAINNVRGWWTETVDGSSENLNDEFEVRFGDVHYSRQRILEIIPDKKVVWLVTDSHLSFLKDKSEWTNTKISFEIAAPDSNQEDQQTQLRFIHQGLVPAYECYEVCTSAWTGYLQDSLLPLITTGQGQPHRREVTA